MYIECNKIYSYNNNNLIKMLLLFFKDINEYVLFIN